MVYVVSYEDASTNGVYGVFTNFEKAELYVYALVQDSNDFVLDYDITDICTKLFFTKHGTYRIERIHLDDDTI